MSPEFEVWFVTVSRLRDDLIALLGDHYGVDTTLEPPAASEGILMAAAIMLAKLIEEQA